MLDDNTKNEKDDGNNKSYTKSLLDQTKESLKGTAKETFDVGTTLSTIGTAVQSLNKELGGSANLTAVLGTNFTDAGQKILLVSKDVSSLEEAIAKSGDLQRETIEATGRAYMATGNELAGILTAQEASGVQSKVLLENFKEQGFALQAIPKTMEKVIHTARELGVNANAVSESVVKNLDKLNTYNFANGVDGLTKMAAQATMFGIDMGKIFAKAEQLFDPEQAVDMAASLQRLGVATGDLLDPLKLMDLGQNNPQELQNQIVEMSKRFTYFNEQNQKFEILPGAKRELREIGKVVGLNADELAKMAIGSSTLADKMSKIRFPELETGPLTEKQQTMIANLAEMRDGSYKIQFEQTRVDKETGERYTTGEKVEKKVSELTSEDFKSLEYQQQQSAKSLEEIAAESMGYDKRIANAVEAMASTARGTLSTSRLANKGTEFLNEQISKFLSLSKDVKTEEGRELFDKGIVQLRDLAEQYKTAYENDGSIDEQEKKLLEEKGKGIDDILKDAATKAGNVGTKILKMAEEFGPGLIKTIDQATKDSNVGEKSTGVESIKTSQPDYNDRTKNLMQTILDNQNSNSQPTATNTPTQTQQPVNSSSVVTTNNQNNNSVTNNQNTTNNLNQTISQIQQGTDALQNSMAAVQPFNLDLNPLTTLQEKQLSANEGSFSELKTLNTNLSNNNQTLISHLSKMSSFNETIAQNKENKNITNEVIIDPSKLVSQNNQNPTEIKNNIDQSVNSPVTNINNDNRNQTTNNSNVKNNNEFVTNNTETSPIKFELPKVEFMPNSDLTSLITNQEKQFTLFEQRLESMNKGLMTNNSISDLTLSIRDLDKKINQDKTITPPIGSMVNNNITNNTQELTNVDKSNNSPVTNITNDNKNLATNNTNYNNDNKFVTNNTENLSFPKIEIPTFEVPKFDNLSSLLDKQDEKFGLMLSKFENKDKQFLDYDSRLSTAIENMIAIAEQNKNTPTQTTTPTNTEFKIPTLQIPQPTSIQTPNITNISNTTNNNLTENMPQMATNTTSSMSYSGELKLTVDVTAPPGVDPNMVKDAIHKTLHNMNVQESIMKNVTGGRVGQYNPTTGIPV
jgi:transcriptional regulator NrdR family protein